MKPYMRYNTCKSFSHRMIKKTLHKVVLISFCIIFAIIMKHMRTVIIKYIIKKTNTRGMTNNNETIAAWIVAYLQVQYEPIFCDDCAFSTNHMNDKVWLVGVVWIWKFTRDQGCIFVAERAWGRVFGSVPRRFVVAEWGHWRHQVLLFGLQWSKYSTKFT